MLSSAEVVALLQVHGTCRPQEQTEWAGDTPLPGPIADFYRKIGPVDLWIEGYGNPIFMPSLSQLLDLQAGYRWDGLTGVQVPEWNRDWFVVASEGSNPYICWNGRVFFALSGSGDWKPTKVFDDLDSMAACLSILGAVVVNAGEEFTDEDSLIRPCFLDEAVSRLTQVLGNEDDAKAFLETAGWQAPA
jgi:hypothetical protein